MNTTPQIMFDPAKLKLVDPKTLKKDPKNRNIHSDAQIERFCKLLQTYGMRWPILVSERTDIIKAGEGRLLAALKLKMPQVLVSYQEFDSDEIEYGFGISDNAIAAWAELDMSSIHTDLKGMDGFDIDLLGIEDFELIDEEKVEPGCDEDEVPETPVEPKTKIGDLYILGKHRLLCGDSTVITDVEKLMNGQKADMWSSDPPYGINFVEVANEKGQAKGYSKIENDELQDEALKEFIYQSIVTALPSMNDGFAFYMWHAMKMQAYFSQAAAAAAAAGILFHRQIIWVKPQFVFGRGQYHWRHELCLMGWLKGNEPNFYGERNQDTVWNIGRENDKIHPTQKPVEIFSIPIKNHLKAGQITYEPFAGSGTQFIAAEKANVRCYGIELSPQYCDVIVERWEKYSGKKAVLHAET